MRTMRWIISMGVWMAATLGTGVFSNAHAAVEDYVGAYACTFGGEMTGTAIVQVDTEGNLYGVIWSAGEQTTDIVAGGAMVDEDGHFTFTSFCGMTATGAITTDGDISGTWSHLIYSGSFSGHADNDSPAAFAGTYTGTFGGDVSGTWTTTISEDGRATGEMLQQGEEYPDEIWLGLVDGAGNIIALTYDEISIKGTVTDSGAISGVWTDGNYSGTFTSQTGSSGGGGGGGGGGCFIADMISP